jgi:hypothetical protein
MVAPCDNQLCWLQKQWQWTLLSGILKITLTAITITLSRRPSATRQTPGWWRSRTPHNNQPYWWLGNGQQWPVCPEMYLMHKQCGGSLAQGLRHCLFCVSRNTTTVDKECSGCWSQATIGQHCDSTFQWCCLPQLCYWRPMMQNHVNGARP